MHSALFASLVFYALLVLAGGAVGYARANSRASLIAGSAFGALLTAAAWLVATGSLRLGAGLGVLAALALIARFLPAFRRTKKLMPAGAVVATGCLVLILGALALVSGA